MAMKAVKERQRQGRRSCKVRTACHCGEGLKSIRGVVFSSRSEQGAIRLAVPVSHTSTVFPNAAHAKADKDSIYVLALLDCRNAVVTALPNISRVNVSAYGNANNVMYVMANFANRGCIHATSEERICFWEQQSDA